MKEINIFISFASDAEKECDLIKKIIRQGTDNYFSEDGYNFKPMCWRDVLPGLGHPQEEKIDPIIAEPSCRLVIIILKNKLGTIHKNESIEEIDNFSAGAKEIIKRKRGIQYDEKTKHLIVTNKLTEEEKDELIELEELKPYTEVIKKLFQQSHETGIEHEYELAKKLGKEIMIYHCDFLVRSSEIEPDQLKGVNKFLLRTKNEGKIEDKIPSIESLDEIFRSKFAQWAKKLIKDLSKNDFEQISRGF